METQEIKNGNKIIAMFDCAEYVESSDSWIYSLENDFRRYRSWRTFELSYHSSWDWLMPVWFKFRDLKISDEIYEEFEWRKTIIVGLICLSKIKTPIEAFEKLVEAIEWYNQNKS